jgi:hypothetical protein
VVETRKFATMNSRSDGITDDACHAKNTTTLIPMITVNAGVRGGLGRGGGR